MTENVFGGQLGPGGCVQPFPPSGGNFGYTHFPTQFTVFADRKPKAPDAIRAAKVTKDNLANIAVEVLNYGTGEGVYIPSSRDRIRVGTTDYCLDEWIVAEHDKRLTGDTFRHATEEETKVYGLV